MPLPETSRWWYIGELAAANVYQLPGPWLSLGVHLSAKPLYVDLHVGWWVVSLMSAARGHEIQDVHEAAYFYSEQESNT